jgi:hypothetical protein
VTEAAGDAVTGGLVVLGSLHAELVALLEDRDAPLYNRTTDQLELQHLDLGSVLHVLDVHGVDLREAVVRDDEAAALRGAAAQERRPS